MLSRRSARWTLAVLLIVIGIAGVVYLTGCESNAADLTVAYREAQAAAIDAQEAAARAEAAARESGDPEAIAIATEARNRAEIVSTSLDNIEAQVRDWAEAFESGEFGAAEGSEIGSLLGLIDPRAGAIGTILGGVIGGWYYRNRARQIVNAIDAGKAADPTLDEAFGSDAARKAISHAMSPATWKFVEHHRD